MLWLGYQLLGEFTLKELQNKLSLEASFTKYLVLQGNNPIVFNRDQLHTISFTLLFQSVIPGESRFSPLAVSDAPEEVPLTPALLPFPARQGHQPSPRPRGDPEHTWTALKEVYTRKPTPYSAFPFEDTYIYLLTCNLLHSSVPTCSF